MTTLKLELTDDLTVGNLPIGTVFTVKKNPSLYMIIEGNESIPFNLDSNYDREYHTLILHIGCPDQISTHTWSLSYMLKTEPVYKTFGRLIATK